MKGRGITQFSKEWEKEKDGTIPDESARAMGLIYDPNDRNTPEELERLDALFKDLQRTTLPASYDSPHVTAVQNQGACGSCSAFAAVGAAESCLRKAAQAAWFSTSEGLNIGNQTFYLFSQCYEEGICYHYYCCLTA